MEANDLFKEMDQETADYIVTHYLHLLNHKEKLANRHLSSMIKLDLPSSSTSNLNSLTNVYRKIGWLTEDEDALALVKLGEEAFRLKSAIRISLMHQDKVFLISLNNADNVAMIGIE